MSSRATRHGLFAAALLASLAVLPLGLAAQALDGDWEGRGCKSDLRMKVEGSSYQITINETTFKGQIVDGKRIDLNMPGAAQRHFRGEFVGDRFKAWVFNSSSSGSGPNVTPCRETFDLVRAGAPPSVAKVESPPTAPAAPVPAAASPASAAVLDGAWEGRGCGEALQMTVQGGQFQIRIGDADFRGPVLDGDRIDLNVLGAAQRYFKGRFVGDVFKASVFNSTAGAIRFAMPCKEEFDLVRRGAATTATASLDGAWVGRGCGEQLRLAVSGNSFQITIIGENFRGPLIDRRRIDLDLKGTAQRLFRGEFEGDRFKGQAFITPANRAGAMTRSCQESFVLAREGTSQPAVAADPPPAPAAPAAVPAPAAAPPPPAKAEPAPSVAGGDAVELAFWDTIKGSTNPADFRAYLDAFPNGRFASLARLRAQPPQTAAAPPTPAAPSTPAPRSPPAIDFGTYHALIIGNDAYRNVPRLKTAVRDAQTVAQLLRDSYGFNTRVLTNATRHEMLTAMTAMRQSLGERDNLLIFYAGHGVLDNDTERGYWLPIDAEKDNPANWVSNADLTDVVKALRARHVLVIADSCYSGTLVRAVMPDFRSQIEQEAWWQRVAGKRSRAALTSGGLEPVLDGGGAGHSVFARAFVQALQENDSVLDASGLFKRVQRPVIVNSDQTPAYSDIRGAGHDGGEFLFVRRR